MRHNADNGRTWIGRLVLTGLALGSVTALVGLSLALSADARRVSTTTKSSLLERAEAVLFQECMARRGFDIPLGEPTVVADDRSFSYAVDDVRWASAHGYGSDIYARIAEVRKTDPVQLYLSGLKPNVRQAALRAANGDPSDRGLRAKLVSGAVVGRSADSCVSRAQQRLYGDVRTWYRVTKRTDNLPPLWIARVLDDPRYLDAVDAWSDCMRERGFPYASPTEARQRATGRPAEVRTAVAEAGCANRTELSSVTRRLEATYSKTVRARYASDLRTKHRLERAALPLARRIVAAS